MEISTSLCTPIVLFTPKKFLILYYHLKNSKDCYKQMFKLCLQYLKEQSNANGCILFFVYSSKIYKTILILYEIFDICRDIETLQNPTVFRYYQLKCINSFIKKKKLLLFMFLH